MQLQTFEIRVALVGYVSVGKSTVLNALLGDKYSEVSLRRTTAGINMFRLHQGTGKTKDERRDANKVGTKYCNIKIEGTEDETVTISDDSSSGDSSSHEQKPDTRSATSTHEEICKDNAALRATTTVQEKEFDIKIEDPLCEMRENTQLVLIDIPGVNEADSRSKYKDYVKSKWNTFDCVIVVMDCVQGVNTEEQVDLLRFVKKNNDEEKDIPTIILGNKVDDPEDPEKKILVQESRDKVIEIFGEGCSEKSLKALLKAAKDGNDAAKRNGTKPEATFIPLSAMHAFLYRKASKLTLEQFKALEKATIDKIGHEEVGRKWRSMSDEDKFATIQAAVSDPSEYQERLSATNFDTFLSVLSYYVGGEEVQTKLLQKQLDVKLKNLTFQNCISDQIHSIQQTATGIGVTVVDLKSKFWSLYTPCKEAAFAKLNNDMDVSALSELFSELVAYHHLMKMLRWDGQDELICRRMKELVQEQLAVVSQRQKKWSFDHWYKIAFVENGQQWKKPDKLEWKTLSPTDWATLLSSTLLFSSNKYFRQELGQEYVQLDRMLRHHEQHYNPLVEATFVTVNIYNRNLGHTNQTCNIELPEPEENYLQACRQSDDVELERNGIIQLKMPSSLSDPSHWGHLAWKYCTFCRQVD